MRSGAFRRLGSSDTGPTLALRRRVALGLAVTRVALGLVAVFAPGVVLRPWIGDEAAMPGPTALGRALGGRDLALGLGALLAARRARPIRGWVEAGALADVLDTVATSLSFGQLPARGRWLILGSASGAAVTGALVARSLESPEPGRSPRRARGVPAQAAVGLRHGRPGHNGG